MSNERFVGPDPLLRRVEWLEKHVDDLGRNVEELASLVARLVAIMEKKK